MCRRRFGKISSGFRSAVGLAASAAVAGLLVDWGEAERPAVVVVLCAAAGAAQLLSSIVLFARPRNEVLHLERFGVTAREKEFVLEFLGGKSMKEISVDQGVAFSTVRNAFSSVYCKLKLSGGEAELLALGMRYHVE